MGWFDEEGGMVGYIYITPYLVLFVFGSRALLVFTMYIVVSTMCIVSGLVPVYFISGLCPRVVYLVLGFFPVYIISGLGID